MEGNYTKWLNRINAKQDQLQNITGNIGVGKTDASATEKLDVNGNVVVSVDDGVVSINC